MVHNNQSIKGVKMEEENGFYKLEGGEVPEDMELFEALLLFGQSINGAYGAYNFYLSTLTEDKTGCVQSDNSIIYFPHDGWYYFETRQDARNFFLGL